MSNKKTRSERFTFLCNADERKLITAIAKHLNRSQADSIRFLVNVATKELLTDEHDDLVNSMVSLKSADESGIKNND